MVETIGEYYNDNGTEICVYEKEKCVQIDKYWRGELVQSLRINKEAFDMLVSDRNILMKKLEEIKMQDEGLTRIYGGCLWCDRDTLMKRLYRGCGQEYQCTECEGITKVGIMTSKKVLPPPPTPEKEPKYME